MAPIVFFNYNAKASLFYYRKYKLYMQVQQQHEGNAPAGAAAVGHAAPPLGHGRQYLTLGEGSPFTAL